MNSFSENSLKKKKTSWQLRDFIYLFKWGSLSLGEDNRCSKLKLTKLNVSYILYCL